jgi:SAM-dependent methyltransferase
MSNYVFDNRAPETQQRFGALEEIYDPISIRHLEPYVVPGAHCLEVGGGSGSIAQWMSERVGGAGRVVVTDINTRFLDTMAAPNVEIRRHDITSDPLEEAAFDVAHPRLVLLHLPERERALDRMIAALKPGGWLVVQEFDSLSMKPDPAIAESEHLLKSLVVLWQVMQERHADVRFGRNLFPLLESRGLQDVRAEGHVTMHRGGGAGARLLRANFDQMHEALIDAGLTQAEFDADRVRMEDPSRHWPSQIMWTAWGRRP